MDTNSSSNPTGSSESERRSEVTKQMYSPSISADGSKPEPQSEIGNVVRQINEHQSGIATEQKSKPSENSPPQQQTPPVTWNEIIAVLAGIVLVDVTLYHGAGFSGIAVFLLGWGILLWRGVAKPSVSGKVPLIAVLLFITTAKLIWCGFFSTIVAGFVLLFFFGILQSGYRLSLFSVTGYFYQTILGGFSGLAQYWQFFIKRSYRLPSGTMLAVGLPISTVFIFGTIFVLANPSLVTLTRQMFDKLTDFVLNTSDFLPAWAQIFCWICAAFILTGMIRPAQHIFNQLEQTINILKLEFFPTTNQTKTVNQTQTETAIQTETVLVRSPYYVGYRNTIIAVIILFLVYLVFEFKTLWFHDFPAGFCYSDYSHRGAAWLMVALALSTVILSLIFTPEMYREQRIVTLQRLAWIWSILNFVLAIAVYHRLFLYINFNGMTRMRVVGLLGMTAVLIGFIMVVRKIAKQQSFFWLLSRFTWTVLVMVFLDFVLPVDWLVHQYNVARILKNDYAPAVQISVHPCANEGYLTFLPLAVNCQDEIIRNGIRSLLLQKLTELDQQKKERQKPDGKYLWTKYQIADEILFRQLDARRDFLKTTDLENNDSFQSIQRFKDYVYQWY
ncbi:MAG: DUF4173 domain-containing protein [Planctomycetaceae bacterium]|jgi:hypothetical protein|nr:DUF4173 domain-containing protein [Planctomycetaceae bacterium]